MDWLHKYFIEAMPGFTNFFGMIRLALRQTAAPGIDVIGTCVVSGWSRLRSYGSITWQEAELL